MMITTVKYWCCFLLDYVMYIVMKRECRVWQGKQVQDIKSVHEVARYTEINIMLNVLISGKL